jgi:hypothetical protein
MAFARWVRAEAPVAGSAALATALFTFLVGNRFSGPLAGSGDVSIWEYLGYYVSQYLRFCPLPHLDLRTDQAFFPYGVNNVFQPWALERDGFFAVFFSLFGPGPWLQIYYSLSVFVTLAGVFWLLRRDFGPVRAALTGVLVTFFSAYPVHQYPNHLNICVLHWMTLSLLTDFVLVRRIVLCRPLSLRLVLLRLALASLSLGLDLGYIAGFALMSLTLSAVFVLALTTLRAARRPASIRALIDRARRAAGEETREHPVAVAALGLLWLVATYLYVPPALQIAAEARAFDLTSMPQGGWNASPWRLLLPYFPSFNPQDNPFSFADSRNGQGSGSVGWTLLVLGVCGLRCAGKSWHMYVPVLAMAILCIANHPSHRSTLGIFPWFAFARVADRATVIYPIALAALALSLDKAGLRPSLRRAFVIAMFVLGTVEARTLFSLPRSAQVYTYSGPFFRYVAAIRRQEGEALLDWPFCVTGGNAVGSDDGLCPYYTKNHDDLSYAPYHRKKLVGEYFGRLHPSQLRPFLRAHWQALFAPDDLDIFRARGQTRCFDEDEWRFFSEFFALNDFAGLQLHTSLLPPACVNEFYARFGRPRVELSSPDGDDLAFVAKPPALRARVDPALGRSLLLRAEFEPGATKLDLLASPRPSVLDVDGLSALERSGTETWRWGLTSQTTLGFFLRGDLPLTIRFTFVSPDPRQEVQVLVDGTVAARFVHGTPWANVSADIGFAGHAGYNVIEFRCSVYNGKDGQCFAPDDPRLMSIRFSRLTLD